MDRQAFTKEEARRGFAAGPLDPDDEAPRSQPA
jgi:hypothetical protein